MRDLADTESLVADRQDAQIALCQALLVAGKVTAVQLTRALRTQARSSGDLGAILIAQGLVDAEVIAQATAQHQSAARLPADTLQPDVRLVDLLGAHRCLALMCLPVRRVGGLVLVACARPADFSTARAELEQTLGTVEMAIVTEMELTAALARLRNRSLRDFAQSCVSPNESCRTLGGQGLRRGCYAVAVLFSTALVFWPIMTLQVVTALAVFMLILSGGLKLLAIGAMLRGRAKPETKMVTAQAADPTISILVPMYKEPETVPRLINRLSRLTWPRHLLDVLLVVEETDNLTRGALAQMTLPRWMRVIVVPDAPLRTKPRALNYAMLFARGSLIGVYDAEDAP
ncbi:MAG: glycosyl transferase, partial [Roseinatronobacter sp.]